MRIETKEHVDEMLIQATGLSIRTLQPVELHLPHLSPDQNYEYEEKLNKLRAVCGCRISTVLALIAAVCYVLLVGYFGGDAASYIHITGMLVAFVAGGVVGKMVGLIPTRNHLKMLLSGILLGFPEDIEET